MSKRTHQFKITMQKPTQSQAKDQKTKEYVEIFYHALSQRGIHCSAQLNSPATHCGGAAAPRVSFPNRAGSVAVSWG